MSLRAVTCALVAGAALCSCATGEAVEPAGPDASVGEGCTGNIQTKVMTQALKVNPSATIASTDTLFGTAQSMSDVVLVRVTDPVEPSDYIAVRSRFDGLEIKESWCSVLRADRVAHGKVPGPSFISGSFSAQCRTALEKAAADQTPPANGTPKVNTSRLIYGGDQNPGGAAIVRITDNTGFSDYLAVFSNSASATNDAGITTGGSCQVLYVLLVDAAVPPKRR
jgi:hypothetical protein